jgi:hypothetical protein
VHVQKNSEEELLRGRDTRGDLTVQEWVAELQSSVSTAIERWDADPLWDDARQRRAGENLMAYAHGAATRGTCVCVPGGRMSLIGG